MRHRNRHWKSRAQSASAAGEFERALMGEESSERKSFDPREDRKTLQLCRQVQRAISLALAGECADDVLREVYVESVEPMGGASQLLVRVVIPEDVNWVTALSHLEQQAVRLRAIVAQSICRKRTPGLSFAVFARDAGASERGLS